MRFNWIGTVAGLSLALAVHAAPPDDDAWWAQPQRPGDLNGDSYVDVADVIDLLATWGPCDRQECPADLDGNAFVDMVDFMTLMSLLDDTPLMV